MTRETKIGLLVGLAFIIVIGILLSDHMTSTTEVPQAALANTGNSVRDGIAAPISEQTSTTYVVPQPSAPRQPVPAHNDLPSAPRSPETQIRVGPAPTASGPQSPIVVRQNPQSPAPAAPIEPAAPANNSPIEPVAAGSGEVPGYLQNVARQNGETLVAAGGHAEPGMMQKHQAEAGDTVSRMAGRFMGGNTKANRDAIVKANPSLAGDPNKVIVGHTYVIPATAIAAATPAPAPAAPASGNTQVAGADQPATTSTIWYTVKDNDSLWSIAADQLGSGGSYTAIKELNRDVLKGGDVVHPNMRLRLPSRPVASAQ